MQRRIGSDTISGAGARTRIAKPVTMLRGAAAVAVLAVMGCSGTPPQHEQTTAAATSLQVANLHAFARLYGVLRWFHPSDAAATVDWDRFAAEGVRRVIVARDARMLHTALVDLISPFAPTVRITSGVAAKTSPIIATRPAGDGLELVAWEHKGYGDSTLVSDYASKRRHRPRIAAVPGMPQAALWQGIDATPLRGVRVRLRARLRTANHGRGRIWLRVDRGDQPGFSDTMANHPVVGPNWQLAEIVGKVDPDATRIAFGSIMTGGGTVWYDDFELAAEDSLEHWKVVEIKDPDFEADDIFSSWGVGTGSASDASLEGWTVRLDHVLPAGSISSLRVEPATKVISEELFAEEPAPGETIDVELGSGLHAQVPISLYSRNGHTIGDDPARAVEPWPSNAISSDTEFDRYSAIADVVVVWNVLQHFWPYWDLVPADWMTELDRALADSLDDHNMNDHLRTLRRLSAIAADGHATTTCPGVVARAKPPFLVDVVEGQVVVTAAADPVIAPGDVVVSIDGRPATAQLADDEALISGSPQWRLARARQQFAMGPPGSSFALRIRRGVEEFDRTFVRGKVSIHEFSHHVIEHLNDNIYYIDLERAELSDITAIMKELTSARGVIFDLRGYPNSNHQVLSHLLEKPVLIAEGMAIPHVIRPDHTRSSVMTWETSDGELPVLEPHIRGRVAFLTGPNAISYAETMMATVDRYHLGEIVGSATAGTNGNMAEISEPTGCRTRFTGLRATRPDGSRFHLVGIRPTIPQSRTIAGIRAGKDEVLERALAYVRTGAR